MMQTLRNRQRGVTFIGWVFLLTPLALVGYAAMRVAPVYLNYTKVARAFEAVKKEYSGGEAANASRAAVMEALGKRFNIDYIYSPDLKDVEFLRQGTSWHLGVEYEHEVPLFYNLSLLLKFEKSVDLN
jgi:Domain of unknown function (DUF4845)